jgi:hypothetical protein
MLIGINGAAGSGKDTAYNLIKEIYSDTEKVSFAEKLKVSVSKLLNLDVELIEELKNNESVAMLWGFPSDKAYDSLYNRMGEWRLNMREFLQRYGTEAHRDIFGDNFWVDMALPLDTDHAGKILVVTDMRFPNEAERVKELSGHT